MLFSALLLLCASCMLVNAVTVNKQLAVFFEDRYNNYLVLKHGGDCYFWKTSGADAQSLQIQSAQRTLEERLIKAVEAGAQLTPFTPVKTEVSFVIVASCRASNNYHITELHFPGDQSCNVSSREPPLFNLLDCYSSTSSWAVIGE